jgi:hypothetical protein
MDAAKASTLIRARCPELSSRDLEAIEAALGGEEMLPMSALEVILALPERLEERLEAVEGRTPHHLMIARKAH